MNKVEYFKNFPMGTEIDIAGNFIFNGIREFNRMKNFNYESEIFNVLYPIAVGIERLQKVLIVMLEDIKAEDISEFEKSLITHSHQELHNRIIKKIEIKKFNTIQNEFLQLITNFYKSYRYDRFTLGGDYCKEQEVLIEFITKHLNIKIVINELFNTTNDDRIKNFFGRVVGSISRTYYEAIANQAHQLNIYTYELRSESPAQKIFLSDVERHSLQEQYVNEQIALKEFIIFLINTKETNGFYDFIKSLEPLNFDIALAQEYLADFLQGKVSQSLIDEVEFLYSEEVENKAERFEMIGLIGNMNVDFDVPDEDEDYGID